MKTNWRCPVCGVINESRHSYCSDCAAPAPSTTLRCSTCNHICTPAVEDFCPHCGRLLKDLAYSHYLLEHDPVIQSALLNSCIMKFLMWGCFIVFPFFLVMGFRFYSSGFDSVYYIPFFVLSVLFIIVGSLAWGIKEERIQNIYLRICARTEHYMKAQARKEVATDIPTIPLK